MARKFALPLFAVAALAGCATTGAARQRAANAAIDLRCAQLDSRVFLDGGLIRERCGPDAQHLAVQAGHHRVEIRHDGYFSYQRSIDVVKSQPLLLEITLRAVPALHRQELESESPP